MQLNQTALIVFARDTRDEIRHKRLFGSDQSKNAELFDSLNANIKRVAKASGLKTFVFDSDKQKGNSFAERYRNAVSEIFQMGYNQIISFGNDCPEFSVDHIRDINERLKTNSLVYGKTNLGGIYALALTRKGFEKFDFKSVPWQTARVGQSFDALNASLTISSQELPEILTELNSSTDLELFLKRLQNNYTDRLVFGSLFNLAESNPEIDPVSDINSDNFYKNIELRGPPNSFIMTII